MNTVKQHSIFQSIVLHLVPGALITAAYFLIAPIAIDNGYPALLGLLFSFLLVGLPFELGFLFYQANKAHGNYSIKNLISYRNPIPTWQYFAFTLGIIVWAFLSSGLIAPLELFFAESLFSWLPDWFAILSINAFAGFSKAALTTTFIFVIAVNWFFGPVIEDLYFRGYLLPRISQSGKWTPLISTALFSLYHFWQPWSFLSRLVAFYPITHVTWRKKNIYFNFVAHLALNIVGGLLLWLQILG